MSGVKLRIGAVESMIHQQCCRVGWLSILTGVIGASNQQPDPVDAKTVASCADDWSWVTTRRQQKKRKVLAGFARAMGDGALVATVHDLVVLPELQGLGLGRKLLAKVTSQV